jgi:hypothetical protein
LNFSLSKSKGTAFLSTIYEEKNLETFEPSTGSLGAMNKEKMPIYEFQTPKMSYFGGIGVKKWLLSPKLRMGYSFFILLFCVKSNLAWDNKKKQYDQVGGY